MTRNGAGKAQKMIFEKNDKIVFIGDSISDYDRARPVGEGLNSAWGHSYVADVGALLGSAYPELNLRVVNMGIGGNQIRHLDARWQSDVLDLKPDWVSVLIGINDVWRQFDTPAIDRGPRLRPRNSARTYARARSTGRCRASRA